MIKIESVKMLSSSMCIVIRDNPFSYYGVCGDWVNSIFNAKIFYDEEWAECYKLALEVMKPDLVDTWFKTTNQAFGTSPQKAIEEGRAEEVKQGLCSMIYGTSI